MLQPCLLSGWNLLLNPGNPETFTLLSQMKRISILFGLKKGLTLDFLRYWWTGASLRKRKPWLLCRRYSSRSSTSSAQAAPPKAWDETLLDKFLLGLYQQLNDLETCLGKEQKVKESPLGSKNYRLAQKRNFREISLYLKRREQSCCVGEAVRVEIRGCLFFINKLKK